MNLAIGICSWIHEKSQLPELERCLNSISDFYPVYVVDGKWSDLQMQGGRSIQEAIELITSYSNTTLIERPNRLEPQNRNEYLRKSYGNEALMVLDTDEYVEYDSTFLDNLETFRNDNPQNLGCSVMFHSKPTGGYSVAPRVIFNPSMCRYRDQHNFIYFMNRQVLDRTSREYCAGLTIFEDKAYRTKFREEKLRERNLKNPLH
jgi:hypothetical protein